MAAYRQLWKKAAETFLHMLYPPQCLSCCGPVSDNGALCPSCWNLFHFFTDIACILCGTPYQHITEEGTLCGQCIHTPPPYERAASVFAYNATSKALIHRFKYEDGTYAAPYFAAWMLARGKPLFATADLLIPVPMHRFRLWQRHYNQAALLASHISKHTGIHADPCLLTRIRATRAQNGLSHRKRQHNVRNAFTVTARKQPLLAGKRVILIDDVMTTGATLTSCTRALLAAGVQSVSVLTLARTLKE